MQVQIITRVAELQFLRNEWNALLCSSAANSIFLTWEWIATWLEIVRPQADLLTIVVRDAAGELAAVAPFYITRMWLVGVIPYRVLRVLGDQGAGADYPDILVRNGEEGRVLPVLRRTLAQTQNCWDDLWVPQVAKWTGARRRIVGLAGDGANLRFHERPAEFAHVALPATYENYLQGLSGQLREGIRRSARRVARAGAVELIRCESSAELPDLLAALFDLHQRRWQTRGEPGCFGPGSSLRRFHERFAPRALRRGWLRLYALKLAGVIQAVQYSLAYAGDNFQLQEGYDPHGPAGVGNALREHAIRASIDEGLRGYDFLGEFTEHKRRWGARRRMGADVFMGRPTLKNRALFTRPVWPTGRYLREERWAAPCPKNDRPATVPAVALPAQVEI